MTYSAVEQSEQDGLPIMLFRFARGEDAWLFTSAATEYVDGADTYDVLPGVSITAIRNTESPERDSVTITLPRNADFASVLAEDTGPQMALTIFRVHLEDDDIVAEFKGFVGSVEYRGNTLIFPVRPVTDIARRGTLHHRTERACRWNLYGRRCGLDRGDFEIEATAVSIDGRNVTLSATPTVPVGQRKYFVGGQIRFGTETRWLERGDEEVFTMVDPFPSLAAEIAESSTATVYLTPGCDRRLTTCDERFDNAINYGGADALPRRGAFEGNSVL